jgi:diaminopimelate epimerase
MRFVKMQATGNDFVVAEQPIPDWDWPTAARRICDRHFGIGADGVVLTYPSEGLGGDLRMRIWLKDGSELEMCGNGIRCLTKHAVETGMASPRADGSFVVEATAGLRTVWPQRSASGTVTSVRVDMQPPVFDPERVPVTVRGPGPVTDHPVEVDGVTLQATFLSMGNPHATVLLESPVEEFPLARLGPLVERHPLFPKRINFEVFNVVSRDRIRTRVWERGAGMTMACGTGACASFVVAHMKGLVDDAATVESPGGALRLEWDGRGSVFLTGPVQAVYQGEWLQAGGEGSGKPASV